MELSNENSYFLSEHTQKFNLYNAWKRATLVALPAYYEHWKEYIKQQV